MQVVFKVGKNEKSWFLQKAGETWRNFKSELSRKWLYDQNGVVREFPPDKYKFIKVIHWRQFVKGRLCKKFQVTNLFFNP